MNSIQQENALKLGKSCDQRIFFEKQNLLIKVMFYCGEGELTILSKFWRTNLKIEP